MQEHHGRRRPAVLILIDGADARRLHFPAGRHGGGDADFPAAVFFWLVCVDGNKGRQVSSPNDPLPIHRPHSLQAVNQPT